MGQKAKFSRGQVEELSRGKVKPVKEKAENGPEEQAGGTAGAEKTPLLFLAET